MRDHSPAIRCVLRIARRIAAETLTPRMVARTIEYVRAPSSAIWAGVKACSTPSIRTTTGSSTSCAGQAWSSQAPHNPLSAERPLECTSHAASLVMWRPNDRVPSGHMEQFCQHVGPSRRQRHEVMAILFAPKVRPRRLSSWSDAMEDGKAPSCSSHSCRCQSCTGSSGLIRARNPARRGRLRLTTCPRTRCWLPTRTRRKLHSAQMADSCRGGRESMPGQQPRSLNRTPKPSPARWAPTPGGLGSGWGACSPHFPLEPTVRSGPSGAQLYRETCRCESGRYFAAHRRGQALQLRAPRGDPHVDGLAEQNPALRHRVVEQHPALRHRERHVSCVHLSEFCLRCATREQCQARALGDPRRVCPLATAGIGSPGRAQLRRRSAAPVRALPPATIRSATWTQ